MALSVRVRLFAGLREAVGRGELTIQLPEPARLDDAWAWLVREYPALAPRRASLAAAVNRSYAPFDTALRSGDEVAFIPPVSGG